MRRYIDSEQLLELINGCVIKAIKNTPTADVQEVLYCGKCGVKMDEAEERK